MTDIDELMKKAAASPQMKMLPRGKRSRIKPLLPVITLLREKGYTWIQVGEWLKENHEETFAPYYLSEKYREYAEGSRT